MQRSPGALAPGPRLKVLRCEKQDYIDLAVCIACFTVILASRLVFPNY